jgi:hypothetical protein
MEEHWKRGLGDYFILKQNITAAIELSFRQDVSMQQCRSQA